MNILNNLFVEKKNGWFTLRGWEGLFHVDLNTGICDCEEDIIKENISKNIETMVKYKNFILILPTGENDTIDIYDTQIKKYVYHVKLDLEKVCYFDNAVIKEECIFLVNNWSTNPLIYVLDMNKIAITRKILIDRELVWKYDSAGRVFAKDIIVENNTLVLATSTSQYIISIDLCNYTIKYRNIFCKLNGFVTMCKDKKDYWLTDENALVIRWNSENGIVNEYDLKKIVDLGLDLSEQELKYRSTSQGYRGSYMYFNSTVYKQGNIFWIPGRANRLLKLNIFSEQWSTVYTRPEIQGCTSWLICPNTNEDCLYFFSLREEKLLEIDSVMKNICFRFMVKNKIIVTEHDLWYEGNYLVSTLIEFINNQFRDNEFQIKKENTCGKNIWNMLV